jgi:hypothetical protein
VRVPSDGLRSLPNTCSPRRPQAARRSARSASWCARPWTRPRRSRRWVRHRLPSGIPARRPPPPRACTRTAGRSVVTPEGAGRDRPRLGLRSASRRYHPIARRGAPDTRPPAPGLGGRARRTGRRSGATSSTHSGRPRAARAPWAPPSAARVAEPCERQLRRLRIAEPCERQPRLGREAGTPAARVVRRGVISCDELFASSGHTPGADPFAALPSRRCRSPTSLGRDGGRRCRSATITAAAGPRRSPPPPGRDDHRRRPSATIRAATGPRRSPGAANQGSPSRAGRSRMSENTVVAGPWRRSAGVRPPA